MYHSFLSGSAYTTYPLGKAPGSLEWSKLSLVKLAVALTTRYCLPFNSYITGWVFDSRLMVVSHKRLPLSTSYAYNFPPLALQNNTPVDVTTIPFLCEPFGAPAFLSPALTAFGSSPKGCFHLMVPVLRSYAITQAHVGLSKSGHD